MQCGIATDKDLEDTLALSRELLLASTALSLKVFHSEGWHEWHTNDGPAELRLHEVDALRKEIEREHASRASDTLMAGVNVGSENSGCAIANNARELMPLDAFAMTKVDPAVLAKIVSAGSVASIHCIRTAIFDLSKAAGESSQLAERERWLADLSSELADVQVPSKTRSFHISCLKGDLRRYLSAEERHIVEDEPTATSD